MQTSKCRICGEEFVPGAELTPSGWLFGLRRALRYYFLFGVLQFFLWGYIALIVASTGSNDILLQCALIAILVIISGLVISIPKKSRFGRDGYRFYCPSCVKRTAIHLWQRSVQTEPHKVTALRGNREG